MISHLPKTHPEGCSASELVGMHQFFISGTLEHRGNSTHRVPSIDRTGPSGSPERTLPSHGVTMRVHLYAQQ
ncbi:hypothetical protein K450DRAFT_217174 [Umbelopsis ramanniana AG]|uniref:Uncharacterized protein n=1 Tax=Umbelopsis ramanniana AG TaxID=1314678 RepID=A0AAD5EJB3_UMBRA|nr:uncharacterized protein K450DRAFT_217174 [Umbelopsis ramanniana AG]KAI8584619.1 hypothetical protein K450DRAFT_217174 [Umbelopsis ramanniana AG]